MGFLDQILAEFLVFGGNSTWLFISTVPLASPPTAYEGSFYSTSLHFKRCEVIPHFGFGLHFPMISEIEHIFIYPLDTCMSSFEKYLFKSFAHVLCYLIFALGY